MNKNIIIGWTARAIVLILAFVNTRLLIDCIKSEGLAAYSIIISLTPWLMLMNLGLPLVIQNSISRSRGNNEDYRLVRDQAFGTMIVVALALAPIAVLIGWLTHKYLLVNYEFVSASYIIGVILFIYISGVCQLLPQVMYAEHDSFWPNVYPIFSPIWTAVVLIIAKDCSFYDFNQLILLIAFSNLLIPFHAAIRLKIFKRSKFKITILMEQIKSSGGQLLFAFMATVTLSVDYLIMSRTLNVIDVVNYNLTSRLFMAILVVHGVLIAINWTPVSDLMHSNKKRESRESVERLVRQGLIIGFMFGIFILASINPLVEMLTGGEVTSIPVGLTLAFFLYLIIRIWTDTYAMAIQSYGMVSVMNKFLPLQAFISAFGQYYLGIYFGATGIVFGVIISFLVTAAWIIPRKFYLLTSH